MRYVLALDQGTTSSRAILFDHEGRIRGSAQKEFEQIFPRPGWVEHDPREIWSSQISVAAEALSRTNVAPRDIAAIGITNQRETAVVWDRETGEPVSNAIVWQDRRTAGLCDRLKAEGHEATFREKTGLVVDSYFAGTKVRWILDHVEGAREKAEAGRLAFGTVDSWLMWKLTGGRHVTDVTNACRTLLFNIHTGDWDDELLEILGVPRSMLPEVRSSSEVYGETAGDLFAASIPIAGIAGDQQAATFGQRCTRPGMAKNTYGTGCFMLMHTGEEAVPSENNLLTTVAWKLGDRPMEYALEGSVFIAGAVVQWLRDGLGVIRTAPEVEALARSVDDNGGVYLVPAFAGLGAPHWDPYARGTIVGITRGTTAGHLARAALEGIAYQVADVLEAMERDAGLEVRELRVDGGAAANDLLMQFQSDILQAPTVRPAVTETTALGAAYLAGLAVGFWGSPEEIDEQWTADRRFEPALAAADARTLRTGWTRALDRARAWAQDGEA